MKKDYKKPELNELQVEINDICAESTVFGVQAGDLEFDWPFDPFN